MAALVLAHFCEIHGPAVVFTTELHRPLIAPLSLQAASSPTHAPLPLAQSPPRDSALADRTPAPSTPAPTLSLPAPAARPKGCGGCGIWGVRLATELGGRLFVSGQAPRSPHAYARTKRAALRALSVESAEAPVVFSLGDEAELYVLSLPFKLPDAHARGGQRFHALLAAHPDRAVLLHSYAYLVAQLSALARHLHARARAAHDALAAAAPAPPADAAAAAPLRRRNVSAKVLRSLEELLALPSLAVLLHLRAAAILHAAHEALLCVPLDPPPSAAPLAPLPALPDVARLLHLHARWGAAPLALLLPHLLCGNQVIVRAPSLAPLARSVLSALATLLPPALVQRAEHGRYVEAYACNLLAVAPDAPLPAHLDPLSCVLVDVAPDGALAALAAHDLGARASVLLARLTALLAAAPSPAVLARALQLFVLQVLHKTRLFARLARQVDSADDERVRLALQQLEVSRADLPLLRFWASAFRGAAPRLAHWWAAPLPSPAPILAPPSPLHTPPPLAAAAAAPAARSAASGNVQLHRHM